MREPEIHGAEELEYVVSQVCKSEDGSGLLSTDRILKLAMKRYKKRFKEELAELVRMRIIDFELPLTLVEYQGGGYDGCLWEWNYAFYDANCRFYDIVSTGRKGASSAADMIEHGHLIDSKTSFYDLTYIEDQKSFGKGAPPRSVQAVAQWFEHEAPHEMTDDEGASISVGFVCDDCGEFFPNASRSIGAHPSCDGGIHISNDKLICEDCYFAGECQHCQEYVGSDNIVGSDGIESRCEWCMEEYLDELTDEMEELEDRIDEVDSLLKKDVYPESNSIDRVCKDLYETYPDEYRTAIGWAKLVPPGKIRNKLHDATSPGQVMAHQLKKVEGKTLCTKSNDLFSVETGWDRAKSCKTYSLTSK